MGGFCFNCCVMDNPLGDFFREIGDIFDGSSCGYHPSASVTDEHAKKIADELAEVKENIRKRSEKKETEYINRINVSMDDLIRYLDKINKQSFGGKALNLNIEEIQKKNDELKKDIVGFIGNIVDERLVLTDKELSVILEELDDKKRGKNFDAFYKRIEKQAALRLQKKIESTVKKQKEMLEKTIESRLSEVDKSMKEVENAYMEILEVKEQDESHMEATQIKYIYKYGLFDILSDQMKN